MKGFLIARGGKFDPPADGWVQVLTQGEFPNEEAGIVQCCDSEALDAIKRDFDDQAKADNWPGMLVDYDHFSHQKDKPSGAAGWVDKLDRRGPDLWGHVRFSESGERAVRGGEYRLLSPVLTGFQQIAGNRKRPTKLFRVALTNDPNIKGLAPVSNRATAEETTTKESKMEHATVLKELLGLKAEAGDTDIQAAFDALKTEAATQPDPAPAMNRGATTEDEDNEMQVNRERIEALNRRVAELETELIERDASQFDGLVGDNKEAKAAIRELASYNRASLKTLLGAIKPAKKAVEPVAEPVKPVLAPLFNRRMQPLPGAAKPEDAQTDEVTATKVRLHASKLLAQNRAMGMTWGQAFDIAKREAKAGVLDTAKNGE